MIEVSDGVLTALLRNKGMRSIQDLSEETGINRFTLKDVLTGKRTIVQRGTYAKLTNWLAATTK